MHILPVAVSIIYGHIQSEILALLKPVQVYCSRTRMQPFIFFRTLSRSWLQSCTVTIPTA